MRRNFRPSPAFTIVELLIVIVVIGILAAITIVAYNGVQSRARASQASAALSQAKKKLELYKVDNSSYPATGNLAAADIKDGDVSYQYTSDGTTYCLTGTAATTSYKVTDTTSPIAGGCAGHGQGGVAAVTNMAINPSVEANLSGFNGAYGGVSGTLTRGTNGGNSGSAYARATWNVAPTSFTSGIWLVEAVGSRRLPVKHLPLLCIFGPRITEVILS